MCEQFTDRMASGKTNREVRKARWRRRGKPGGDVEIKNLAPAWSKREPWGKHNVTELIWLETAGQSSCVKHRGPAAPDGTVQFLRECTLWAVAKQTNKGSRGGMHQSCEPRVPMTRSRAGHFQKTPNMHQTVFHQSLSLIWFTSKWLALHTFIILYFNFISL